MNKISKKIIFTFLLLFYFNNIKACVCEAIKSLNDFDFIGVYSILEIYKNKDVKDYNSYIIDVAEIIRYKVKNTIKKIVFEGNIFNETSCDISIHKNDKWLFYGNKIKNKFIVEGTVCSYHNLIENYEGAKTHEFYLNNGMNPIESLNKMYSKKTDKLNLKQDTTHFPNRNIESIQTYLDNKLAGKRNIFYPNGNIRFKLNYKNGLLNGKALCMNEKGELGYEYNYLNGIKVDTSIYYYEDLFYETFIDEFVRNEKLDRLKVIELLKKPSPRYIEIYDSKGKLMFEYFYYLNGKKEQERIYNVDGKTVYRYFDIDGKLKREN